MDELLGSGCHRVESFIHLAPGLYTREAGDSSCITVEHGSRLGIAEIVVPANMKAEVIQGMHFPEFGITQENEVIRLYADVQLPFTSEYRIRSIDAAV